MATKWTRDVTCTRQHPRSGLLASPYTSVTWRELSSHTHQQPVRPRGRSDLPAAIYWFHWFISRLKWFHQNHRAVKATRIPLFPSYHFLASAHLSVCCVPTRLHNTNTQRLSLLSVITLLHLHICPSARLCARQPQKLFPLSLSLGCRMKKWHLRVTGQK